MINEKRVTDLLMEMIRIDSESFHEKQMSDFLESYFKTRGCHVYRDNAGAAFGGDGSNILVHIPGTLKGEALCLNAHQDTVSPGCGIMPYIKDGYMYSQEDRVLGGDDKGGIAAIIEAYECLRDSGVPHREFYMLFTICEERNMLGIKNFDYSKLPCKNIMVVDSPGATGRIGLAGPAKDGIVATFTGVPSHAGISPEKGVSAVAMLAHAISAVSWGRIDEETTSNVGRVEGGDATNVVTEKAFFTAEVRSRNSGKLKSQVALIEKACNDAAALLGGSVVFEVSHDYPEIHLNKDSFVYKQLLKAYAKAGVEPTYGMGGGGGDSNIMAGWGYSSCGIGCGMVDVHSTDECLCIEHLLDSTRILIDMLTME